MACGGRHTNYELIYVLLAMLAICGMIILGPSIQRTFSGIVTTLALDGFETAFAAIQHPVGTERLALQKMAGNLAAGDRGCDFFVGEVRRYEGSSGQIVAAYADQTVPDAGDLHIMFITDGIFPPDDALDLPEALSDLAEWNLTPDQINQPLYLVYILVVDYQGGGVSDCR